MHFAIVDDNSITKPNVEGLVFTENQSSFLVGVAAALATKTKNVGFIGGVNVPLIQKFQAGYVAGVHAVNPSIKVQVQYISQPPDFTGFNDPAKGKVIAEGMYDNGADVVYHAAGGSGSGLFTAAKEKNKLAIGVDSDQYQSAPADQKALILTSALKGVDTAVFNFIEDDANGKFKPGYTRSRPEVERRRVRDVEPEDRRLQGEDRRVQAEDHQRPDHGARKAVAHAPASCPANAAGGWRTARGARSSVSSGRVVRPAVRPHPGACVMVAPASPIVERTSHRSGRVARHHEAVPRRRREHRHRHRGATRQMHAMVGENGAGKSTLMKTLYGMHQPDEGTISVNGREVHFSLAGRRDRRRDRHGPPALHAGRQPHRAGEHRARQPSRPAGGRLDTRAARARIKEISDSYGLGLDPDELVENLGVGARQRIEICKVLYRGARILILDEPTAVLVPQEVDELFDNLRGLTAEGLTMLFISHKLDEVLAVADEITVIRRGTTVRTADPKTVTAGNSPS